MNNKKLSVYLIGTEVLLILCIALANLNPSPVLYFVFIISCTGWYSVFWFRYTVCGEKRNHLLRSA